MTNTPEFNLAPQTLTDEQFAVLHNSIPGDTSSTRVLDELEMVGRAGDHAVYMLGDQFGSRTAKLVALSLKHQGDVLLDQTAEELGYPSASEAYDQIAVCQAEAIDTPDAKRALAQVIARTGQGGSR